MDKSFWEDNLLVDHEKINNKAEIITFEEIKKNSKYTIRSLSLFLGSELIDKDELINKLISDKNLLNEFLLLEEFTKGTFQHIVGKITELNIPEDQRKNIIKTGRSKVKDYSKYDKFTAVIKLYKKDPNLLIHILLYQITNRRSQTKYNLDFENGEIIFEQLKPEIIKVSLKNFDENVNDDRKSKHLGLFEIEDNIFIYFIREYKRSLTLKIDESRFDTVCEWIILKIPKSLEYIGVSFDSNINITSFISEILFPIEEVSDEDIKTKYVHNSIKDVEKFLNDLIKSEKYPIVEIYINPAPLKGGPRLMLSDRRNKGIDKPISWFKDNGKNFLENIELIEECKIYYEEHRIRLKFKFEEEGIVINYIDTHLLIPLRERFEVFMLENYNLELITGV